MSNEEKNLNANEPEQTVQTDSVADLVTNEEVASVSDEANAVESSVSEANAEVNRVEKSTKSSAVRKQSKGMSKLFKLIYFPAVALFAVIMLVFSIVDGVYGYKPKAYNDEYYKTVNTHVSTLDGTHSSMASGGVSYAKNYIVSTLVSGGFTKVDEVKDGDEDDTDAVVTTITDWATVSNAAVPTVTVMTSRPSVELQGDMKTDTVLVGAEITNIIAAIPSKGTMSDGSETTSGAIIITVRYDTRTDSNGAASNNAFVAVAMQSLIDYVKNDARFDRDVVVVFTEELDNAYGSYAFIESFKGFNGIVSRASAAVNLDAYGNSGTLALVDKNDVSLDYINAYTKISGSAYNSSVVDSALAEELRINGSVEAFGKIPAIQVAIVGGLNNYGSLADTAENLSGSVIYQEAKFFKSYVDAFANSTTSYKYGENSSIGYFSYFDMGTIAYTNVAAYVIGGLLLALIAAAIALLVVKKTFSIKKLFVALGVQLLVVASTLVAMFGAYFLVALMLTGFGVIPIHAITQIVCFNAGILIAAMFISIAASFGFTSLYKKLFKVTASDVVRGTAMLFGIVGAIACFAIPTYSHIVAWLGVLSLALLIVTVCLNGKLKERFGIGFDRLFVFVFPVIICMPIVMSTIAMLTQLLPLYMLPVTMMLFTAMIGTATPYLDRTVKVFDKIAKKLPMRTQRVERVVTEKVEDRAKKGKFTERTVKRVEKEKVAISYKNYFGVSLIAVIGVIIALFSGGFGVTLGQSIVAPYAYSNSVYNDSLVYEWTMDTDGDVTQKIVVDDLVAYKYVRNAVSGLKWDAVNGQYYKDVYYKDAEIIAQQPKVTLNDKTYTVTTFDGSYSHVTLTISGASKITELKITSSSSGKEYNYSFLEQDTITLRLPYGFGDFTIDVELNSSSATAPKNIAYQEVREVRPEDEHRAMDNIDEWNDVISEYLGTSVLDNFRGGIVLNRSFSL